MFMVCNIYSGQDNPGLLIKIKIGFNRKGTELFINDKIFTHIF